MSKIDLSPEDLAAFRRDLRGEQAPPPQPPAYTVRIEPNYRIGGRSVVCAFPSNQPAPGVASAAACGLTSITEDAGRARDLLADIKIDWRDVGRWEVAFSTPTIGQSHRRTAHCYREALCKAFGRPAGTFPEVSVVAPPEPDLRKHLRNPSSESLADRLEFDATIVRALRLTPDELYTIHRAAGPDPADVREWIRARVVGDVVPVPLALLAALLDHSATSDEYQASEALRRSRGRRPDPWRPSAATAVHYSRLGMHHPSDYAAMVMARPERRAWIEACPPEDRNERRVNGTGRTTAMLVDAALAACEGALVWVWVLAGHEGQVLRTVTDMVATLGNRRPGLPVVRVQTRPPTIDRIAGHRGPIALFRDHAVDKPWPADLLQAVAQRNAAVG